MYKGNTVTLTAKKKDPQNLGIGIFDLTITKGQRSIVYQVRASTLDPKTVRDQIDVIETPAEDAQRIVDEVAHMEDLINNPASLPLGVFDVSIK